MSTYKEHGINISLNTVITLIPVLGIMWFLLKPAMIEAIAEDIDEQIAKQSQPLQNAFKVILRAEIDDIKTSIAMLEFREEHEAGTWLEEHAKLLVKRKIELVAFEEAYDEL